MWNSNTCILFPLIKWTECCMLNTFKAGSYLPVVSGERWWSPVTLQWTWTSWEQGTRLALKQRRHWTSSPPSSSLNIPSWCAYRWTKLPSPTGTLRPSQWGFDSLPLLEQLKQNLTVYSKCPVLSEYLAKYDSLSSGKNVATRKSKKLLVPGSEFPLHQENSNMCKRVFDSSW